MKAIEKMKKEKIPPSKKEKDIKDTDASVKVKKDKGEKSKIKSESSGKVTGPRKTKRGRDEVEVKTEKGTKKPKNNNREGIIKRKNNDDDEDNSEMEDEIDDDSDDEYVGGRKRKSAAKHKSKGVKKNALLKIKNEFELHKNDGRSGNVHIKKEDIDIDDTSATAEGLRDFFDDEFSTI